MQYWRYLKTTSHAATSARASRRAARCRRRSRSAFPATVELALAAMLFAVVVGIPLGFFAAKHYGTALDHASLVVSLIGISIPIFFLAMILKYIFAVQARLAARASAGRTS